MNNDDVKNIIERTPVPKARESARQRIKQDALIAFKEAQTEPLEKNPKTFQGNTDSARLNEEPPSSSNDDRTSFMYFGARIKHFRPSSLAASLLLFFGLMIGSLTGGTALFFGMVGVTDYIAERPFSRSGDELKRSGEVGSPMPLVALELERVTLPSPAVPAEAPVVALPKKETPPPVKKVVDKTPPKAEKKVEAPPGPKLNKEVLALADLKADLMADLRDSSDTSTFSNGAHSPMSAGGQAQDRDRFAATAVSPRKVTREAPVSTFSVDVDTASYSYVRRLLNAGRLPPADAVRVEEMVNYFDYRYLPPASAEEPFSTHVQVIDSPWTAGNKLLHIGIKGYEIDQSQRPDSNLVFLLDVSGSMDSPDKLPLVKQSLGLLLDTLQPSDTVAIVVYAGAAGVVLESTSVSEKGKILAALDNLKAGGSTAGGEGLALAYRQAELNFNKDAVNRVMLATDGDFNVGIVQDERLEDFVARKRDRGIYLSVFGVGQGNYQDALMQRLAQNGNGVAAYIDSFGEAQKLLVEEATSAMFPIANDVKIQVEFNPATVADYRLIGYESRALEREDFRNDKVDAGEIGSGHTVTAIYEITPVGAPGAASYRYQPAPSVDDAFAGELGFLKLRYKRPGEDKSVLMSQAITDTSGIAPQTAADRLLSDEVNFAVAVAGFAQLLRRDPHIGAWAYDDVIDLAQQSKGSDEYGYRTEFIQLVRKAKIATTMSDNPTYGVGRSQASIARVMDRNKGKMFAVYNSSLRANPTLRGRFTVRMVIEPSGKVSSIRLISSQLNDPALEKKLMARVKGINFGPENVGPTTLNYTFNFLPS